jgi:hypothetical protein
MKNRNQDHKDSWGTPKEFYDKLNNEFNFNFDPCPYEHDISKWDGLSIDWKERNFINPPYSRKLKEAFILKAIEESKKGKLCVMLLPVSTSTKIFHEHILPNASDIRFVKRRLKFSGVNTKGEYVTNQSGMHDSMIVVFNSEHFADVIPVDTEPSCKTCKYKGRVDFVRCNECMYNPFCKNRYEAQ